jgi:hypothetical protein
MRPTKEKHEFYIVLEPVSFNMYNVFTKFLYYYTIEHWHSIGGTN